MRRARPGAPRPPRPRRAAAAAALPGAVGRARTGTGWVGGPGGEGAGIAALGDRVVGAGLGAGDLVADEGPARNPPLAAGPGRGVQGAAQRRRRCGRLRVAAAGGSHLRGRDRAGVPGGRGHRRARGRASATAYPGRGPGTRSGPRRLPGAGGAPGASVAATVPAAEAGVLTCPSHTGAARPRSAKLLSLFPPVGTRICSAALLAPSGLPRPALRAFPRGSPPGDTRDGAALSALPEPPQLLPATEGEPSVVSANRLEQKNQSGLGGSEEPRNASTRAPGVCADLVVVLVKFKAKVPGMLTGPWRGGSP